MPTITIIEAKNVICQLDEQISDYRSIVNELLRPKKVEQTTTTEDQPEGTEIIEEEVTISELGNIDARLEKLHDTLDKLWKERTKLEVAMRQFESTQTFTF